MFVQIQDFTSQYEFPEAIVPIRPRIRESRGNKISFIVLPLPASLNHGSGGNTSIVRTGEPAQMSQAGIHFVNELFQSGLEEIALH